MIQLSSSAIMILGRDSSLQPFDAGEISAEILHACLRAGESDTWIGGDIARSVEFALLSRGKHVLTARELSDMVTRSLEDSGYPAVAEEYGKKNGPAFSDAVPVEREAIAGILAGNLALSPAQCRYLADKVAKAAGILGFSKVSPRLVQELARQYRDAEGENGNRESRRMRKTEQGDPVLLSQQVLAEHLDPYVRTLLERKILVMHQVSILFPVIRLGLSLSAFADAAGLAVPVTELAFWNAEAPLQNAIDRITEQAQTLILASLAEKGEQAEEIPFSLEITDTLPFASGYMGCSERYAEEHVSQLMGTLASGLKKSPFKITC